MFKDLNRIKRTELADDVQQDLLTQADHEKLDGLVTNPDGSVSFDYSIQFDVNGTIYEYNGTEDIEITITPETIGAATVDHTHPAQVNITGNSDTTNRLKVPVNIGNASFDGTRNISLSDIGAASSNHNHDTVYSKLTHDHDTVYSKLDHDHPYVYAGSTEVGGPANTAIKLDEKVVLNVTGALTGKVEFFGDEGEIELPLDLGSHTHILPDIDFSGYTVVMDSSGYIITTPENPDAEGEGAFESAFKYHTYDSHKFVTFGIANGPISEDAEYPNPFKSGSEAPPSMETYGDYTLTGVIDNHNLTIEYLNSSNEVIGSEDITDDTLSLNIPSCTMYINVVSDYLSYLTYDGNNELLADRLTFDSIDARNLATTCTRLCEITALNQTCGQSNNLRSFKISTPNIADWSSSFSNLTMESEELKENDKLVEVELNLNCTEPITFDCTFMYCICLSNVTINIPYIKITSAVAMFLGCASLTLPPKSLDYSRIMDMPYMFAASGIHKFPDMDQFSSNPYNPNLLFTFAICEYLSGEIHLPETYTKSRPDNVKLVAGIFFSPFGDSISDISVFCNPRQILYPGMPGMATINLIYTSPGIILYIDNSGSTPLTEFKFSCTAVNPEGGDTVPLRVFEVELGENPMQDPNPTPNITEISLPSDATISTSCSIPIRNDAVAVIIIPNFPNDTEGNYNPSNYTAIRAFKYLDTAGIGYINIGNMNSITEFRCYTDGELPEDVHPFMQSKSIFDFNMSGAHNITDMSRAFDSCADLEHVFIEDTSNVTDMSYMFKGCKSLLILPTLDTSNVKNVNGMFLECDPDIFTDSRLELLYKYEMDPITDDIYSVHADYASSTISNFEISYFKDNKTIREYIKGKDELEVKGVVIDSHNVAEMGESVEAVAGGSSNYISFFTNSSSVKQFAFNATLSLNPEWSIKAYSVDSTNGINVSEILSESHVSTDFTASISMDMPKETSFIMVFGEFETFELLFTSYIDVYGIVCPHMPTLTKFDFDLTSELQMISLGKNNISSWTSKFKKYRYLTTADIFISPVVKSLYNVFESCDSLETVKLTSDSCVNRLNSTSCMFDGCTNLVTVDLFIDTSKVTDISYMFSECASLTTVNGLDTSSATDISGLFSECASLTTVPPSLNTSNATKISSLFRNCSSLTTIPPLDISKATNIYQLFSGCTSLTSIPKLDLTNVTNTGRAFRYCSISSIELENTSNVTDMKSMFDGCNLLTSAPEMDTSNVIDMSYMFRGCSSLTTVPTFNTSKVNDMYVMFRECTSLVTMPKLEDRSVVMKAGFMFYGCTSLKDVPTIFDMPVAYNLGSMYEGCSSLPRIPINTSSISDVDMSNMIKGCTSIDRTPLINFSYVRISEDVFNGTFPNGDGTINMMINYGNRYAFTGLFNTILEGTKINIYHDDYGVDAAQRAKAAAPYEGSVSLFNTNNGFNIEFSADNPLTTDNTLSLTVVSNESGAQINYSIYDVSGTFISTTTVASGEEVDIASKGQTPIGYIAISSSSEITELSLSGNVSAERFICLSRTINMINGLSSINPKYASIYYSNLKSAKDLFSGCSNLLEIDILNIPNKITDMSGMFKGCSSLTTIPPEMDTSKVETMQDMFNGCSSLTTIPELNTSKVTNMKGIFTKCAKITSIPQLDTSNVTNMNSMFSECNSLTSVPEMDTANVTDMGSMFNRCSLLTEIPKINTSNVTNMSNIFAYCFVLSSMHKLDTAKVTDMSYMFYYCKPLTTIPLLDTSKVTNMKYMFSYCTNLTTIPLLDTSNVTNMSTMFGNCDKLTNVPLLDTSNVTNMGNMFYYCTSLTTIPELDTSNVTSMYGMFAKCNKLPTIPLLDTSNVVDMSNMFDGCKALTTIPMMNTSNVTNMGGMFWGCSSIPDIPLLDTSNVFDTGGMFYACRALTTIPLIDTSNVGKMNSMFSQCDNLTTIPLLDTSNVTTMNSMFSLCTALVTGPYLNTANVTNMNSMFSQCGNLTTISILDTSKVTNMDNMFSSTPKLTSIPVLDMSNVTSMNNMFNGSLSNDGCLINIMIPSKKSTTTTYNNIFKSINANTVINIYHTDTAESSGFANLLLAAAPDATKVNLIDITNGFIIEFNSSNLFNPTSDSLTITVASETAEAQVSCALCGSDNSIIGITTVSAGTAISIASLASANVKTIICNCKGGTVSTLSLSGSKPSERIIFPTEGVSKVVGLKSINPTYASIYPNSFTDMSNMFNNCTNLISVDILKIGTTTLSTSSMFSYCTKLTSLPSNPITTTSNVTSMSSMFYECTSLTSIPKMDTSNVNDMTYMFYRCSSLAAIPELDTSKVTDMNSMFYECTSLTSIPELNTSKVTNMDYMFFCCSSLATIPLLDTSNVTNMVLMLYYCSSLTTIPLLNTSNVISMNNMLGDCSSLTSIPKLDTSNVVDIGFLVCGCTKLTTIPPLDTSSATSMERMFWGCTSLTSIPKLDTSNVITMNEIFSDCSNLTTVPQLDTSKATNMYAMFNGCSSLTSIPELDTSSATSLDNIFRNCTSLTSTPLLDTSKITDMSGIFWGCTSLTSIPELDTSSATEMNYTFAGCSSLTSIPEIDTSNVTIMRNMFDGCTNLTSIPELNTSNVISMQYMFSNCTSLTTIPLLDTSNVVDMSNMFSGCTNLTSIPLLNTPNVDSMSSMFKDCTNLTTIPLLDTCKVEYMNYMFSGCTSLTSIPLLDFSNVIRMNYAFNNSFANDGGVINILVSNNNSITLNNTFDSINANTTINIYHTSKSLSLANSIKAAAPDATKVNLIDITNGFILRFKEDAPFNPASDRLIFEVESSGSQIGFDIYDTSGGLIANTTVTNTDSISLASLTSSTIGLVVFRCSNIITELAFTGYKESKEIIFPTGGINKISRLSYVNPVRASIYNNNLTSMNSLFTDCTNLISVDILKINTSTKDLRNMFYNCSSLTSIPPLDTSNVTDMSYMFYYCSALTTIPKLNTSNVTKMYYMFFCCSALTTIPLLDTSNVTDMGTMFSYCTSLTTIPLLDTSNVTNMGSMFYKCNKLTSIPELDTSNVTYMAGMFEDCTSLTTIPLLDTSNVTNMCYTFRDCTALTTIPLLDTSKVTTMQDMFSGCTSLTSIPLLNTSNVDSMLSMFSGCTSLTSIPELDTSNVDLMEDMFSGCTSLTTLVYPNLNTSKVTYMRRMFYGCTKLNAVDLSNLDTRKVTNMMEMFEGCSSLTFFKKIDVTSVENAIYMFSDCSSLMYMPDFVGNFKVLEDSRSMFSGCTQLSGQINIESTLITAANCANMFKGTTMPITLGCKSGGALWSATLPANVTKKAI